MNQAINWKKDDGVLLSDDLNDLDGFSIKEDDEEEVDVDVDDEDSDEDDEESSVNKNVDEF